MACFSYLVSKDFGAVVISFMQVKTAAKSFIGIPLGADAASFQIKELISQIAFLNGKVAEANI